MSAGLPEVARIVDDALEAYGDDAAAVEVLESFRGRLREPLRLAVAGIVKAGKSTLLNALIGERIAPTDAGECTRTITWYRYGSTARVDLRMHDGRRISRPVRRSEGRLVLDMGGYSAEEVAWIDVAWPSENLRSTVLIDTPGIASLTVENSARSTDFFIPKDTPTAADAIIYLLRHVHAEDLKFLEAFRDTAAGESQTVNALAALSRADEIGSGRIDSLLSAAKIADRYRRDGELRSLALDVIPVAGLLAEGGRTLRESEFIALRHIAMMDRAARDRLLLTVDRFTRATDDTALSVEIRRGLLRRFGLFGVRLAAALIRGGASSSSALSDRLVQQSGLIEVQRFVEDQFRGRAFALKARGILHSVERLVRERPKQNTAGILSAIERLTAQSHDLRELSLLAELRTAPPELDAATLAEAERIVGGGGLSAARRLGLSDDAEPRVQRERVDDLLTHWRSIAESPLTDRHTADLCRGVVRSVEGAASDLLGSDTAPSSQLGNASADSAADVVLSSGPA
ncbi:dynamin family protein [uncultured Microbacterium sp.]|uniref:dynamin family protein n=1 Tax=uncultured Microbacterium sp. TaxID=191216 RepID=UPI0025DB783D|nr:dynamin family protein [uncultured Microbacterium sp.]